MSILNLITFKFLAWTSEQIVVSLIYFVEGQNVFSVRCSDFEVASRHKRGDGPLESKYVGLIWSFILDWILDLDPNWNRWFVSETTYLHTLWFIRLFLSVKVAKYLCLAQRLYSPMSITGWYGYEKQFCSMWCKQKYCVNFPYSPLKRIKAFQISPLPNTAVWEANVIVGVLRVIMDHEGKGHTKG